MILQKRRLKVLVCALTAAATIINSYALALDHSEWTTDPGKLNQWLGENGGYDPFGGVRFNKTFNKYTNSGIKIVDMRTGTLDSLGDTINNELNECNPVIAQVKNPTTGRLARLLDQPGRGPDPPSYPL